MALTGNFSFRKRTDIAANVVRFVPFRDGKLAQLNVGWYPTLLDRWPSAITHYWIDGLQPSRRQFTGNRMQFTGNNRHSAANTGDYVASGGEHFSLRESG